MTGPCELVAILVKIVTEYVGTRIFGFIGGSSSGTLLKEIHPSVP